MTTGSVSLVLAKSREADAVAAYLRASRQDLSIADQGTFLRIDAAERIDVDLDGVEEYFGMKLPLGQFLVVMTSYVGRIDLDDRRFTVSSAMLQLEDDGTRPAPPT